MPRPERVEVNVDVQDVIDQFASFTWTTADPAVPFIEPTPPDQQIFVCPDCLAEHADETSAERCCQFQCPNCRAWYRYEEDAEDCCRMYHCRSCGTEWRSEEEANDCCYEDSYDEDYPRAVVPAGVEGLAGTYDFFLDGVRPSRLTSIEQEVTAGAGHVLGAFRHYDWITQNYLDDDEASYDGVGSTVVKGDGSLPDDGCEIVYGKWKLWTPTAAKKLGKQLTVVRGLRDQGHVRSGRSAGTHIHIGAKDMRGESIGARDVSSLYGVVCHVEDLLYRLAAAGWSMHRRDDGREYSEPMRKMGNRKKTAFRIRQEHPGRYYAVNFERLFYAVNNCTCGACRMGSWEDCSCDFMDAATVEWRIFNSSTKPETLHAWTIVAHALLDRATKEDYSELKHNDYGGSHTACHNQEEQIGFLFECEMTSRERAIVMDRLSDSPGINL